MQGAGEKVLAHTRLTREQHVDGRVDRGPELLHDLLHGQRLAHHEIRVEGQILLPRVARQNGLVPPDVVNQSQHHEVAESVQPRHRRPVRLLRPETGKGGHHRVPAVHCTEGEMADPSRRAAQLTVEGAAGGRTGLGGAAAENLFEQPLAAGQPCLVRRHHQLDAGVLLIPQQQEEGTAPEIQQNLLDQGL